MIKGLCIDKSACMATFGKKILSKFPMISLRRYSANTSPNLNQQSSDHSTSSSQAYRVPNQRFWQNKTPLLARAGSGLFFLAFFVDFLPTVFYYSSSVTIAGLSRAIGSMSAVIALSVILITSLSTFASSLWALL